MHVLDELAEASRKRNVQSSFSQRRRVSKSIEIPRERIIIPNLFQEQNTSAVGKEITNHLRRF